MKKLIILLMLVATPVYAADITITVPDNKLAEFKAGFLKVYPVPDANNDGTPDFTDNQWIKKRIEKFMNDTYKAGKQRLARDGAAIDGGVIA